MSRPRIIGLLLALVTLVVYLPVAHFGFINYDDGGYVAENQHVQDGLTWAGVSWAFTTWHASNWHPLTWLSHMLDCQLFGLDPGAHHFVNALIHSANTVLVFALLWRLTNKVWPAAFIAALFGWHPLHVESVAWISERKDVLSTFFGLLALLSYAKAVTSDKWPLTDNAETASRITHHASLFPALIFFALSLLAKPMLVTLPFVLLLLDFWPLQRFSLSAFRFPLLLEKVPFFLLTAVSCVVTFLAQRNGDAVVSLAKVSLLYRLENAVVAFGGYLQKIVWPSNLAIIYPMPEKIPRIESLISLAALFLISVVAWRTRRRQPYLLLGWLWFLGTLMPVIGIVKVGDAALADRYSYIPSLGIFIAVTFGALELAERFQLPKIIFTGAGAVMLAGCLLATEKQLGYWRNDELLFGHALAVTKDNADAELNFGVALEQKGRNSEALAHYREALRLGPLRVEAHNNLGNLLDNLGQPQEAITEYREAIRLDAQRPALHDSLGVVLVELGRCAEGMAEFTNAARLDPKYPWPNFQMGKTLLKQGRDAEAIDQLRAALRLDPDNFQILAYLAHVLAAAENPDVRDVKTALELAAKANALTSGAQPQVLDVLGMACAATGDFTNAMDATQRALDLATAAQMKNLDQLRQRLELYKNHQPWRESFRATNAPVKN